LLGEKNGYGFSLYCGCYDDWLRCLGRCNRRCLLGGRFLEAAARQPELVPMLRTNFFLVAGLVDAVPMIAVGLAMYVLFAVAG